MSLVLVVLVIIILLFLIGSMQVSGRETDVEGFVFERMEVREIGREK